MAEALSSPTSDASREAATATETRPDEGLRGHVLVVDDDADVQQAVRLLLSRHGYGVSTASQPAQIWSALALGRGPGSRTARPVDVILLDLNFSRGAVSGAEGFACLAEIVAHDPRAVVVVATGHSGINIAVQAMRAGAADFVMKPWSHPRLLATLDSALELRRRRLRDGHPSGQAPAALAGDGGALDDDVLLGESAAMARVRDLTRRAAPTRASVLILGEAGTGKSLVARTLHRQSQRANGPFVRLDLPTLKSEAADALFGGPQGPGALAQARTGTLVLDEVAALTPALQSRLVAALEVERVDARLIATSRSPRGALGLREDLLCRLDTVEIALPALHLRDGDVRLIAEHYLRLFADRHGRPHKPLSADALEAIGGLRWTGEVRGLRQAMERCAIFTDGPAYTAADLAAAAAPADDAAGASSPSLAETERALVTAALKRASFNVSHAAKALGLTRAALYRRMAKHGL